MPELTDAEMYRLAQANKLIRLRLVRRDDTGRLVCDEALMREMSPGPISPDPIDFLAVRR